MINKINAVKFSTLMLLLMSLVVVLPASAQGQTVEGTADDTAGVWLYSAGTAGVEGACESGIPGGEPTDLIVENGVAFDILEFVGDELEEVFDFTVGDSGETLDAATTSQPDVTVTEIVAALSTIDDFGSIGGANDEDWDDDANHDVGTGGSFYGFLRNPDLKIVADGVVTSGVLGADDPASAAEADANLDGCEMFIFEDAELSGMTVEFSSPFNTYSFDLADRQIDPNTEAGADDTLICVDLDSFPNWDGSYVIDLRITDDGIPMMDNANGCPNYGDTSVEIDAIAVRGSVAAAIDGSIGDTVFHDLDGDGVYEPDENESPLPDVTVTLTDPGGNVLTNVTDENGYYLFEDIPFGIEFTVGIDVSTLPVGIDTMPTSATDPGTGESDGDQSVGTLNYPVLLDMDDLNTLEDEENELDADFGFQSVDPAADPGQTVEGTADDTAGVWLYSAGTAGFEGACESGIPAGEPTDVIIFNGIEFDIIEFVGDEPEEVFDFTVGASGESISQPDTTVAEILSGLTTIDDFGNIGGANDDDANHDVGTGGSFRGFLRNPDLVIVADGVVASGMLGPDVATSAAEADTSLDGCEMFIFEDSELSGMTVEFSSPFNTYSFDLADRQIDPNTEGGADDTLICVDLDSFPDWDGTYVVDLRITDDGIPMQDGANGCGNYGDTSVEIDAIAVRKSVVAQAGSMDDIVSHELDGDGAYEPDEDAPFAIPFMVDIHQHIRERVKMTMINLLLY